MSSGEIWYKYPEDQFQISQIPRGAAEGYLGDLKLVRGVFVRYPTRCVKNSTRRSRVEFLTYRVGYRAKLHELPFPRISPNTTRRSRVVFGLIRGNGNECNFAQMSCRMANCSRVVFVSNTTNEITDFVYTIILGSINNIIHFLCQTHLLLSWRRTDFFFQKCGFRNWWRGYLRMV